MRKGRAVCSAVDGIIFGRPRIYETPKPKIHKARIPRNPREIDGPVQMREIVVLAA